MMRCCCPIFFIPNTMYKYLLPAYPAIALLCGYAISKLKDVNLQKFITLNIIATGVIISLFVFHPLCMTVEQINVKESVEEIEKLNAEEVDMIYVPFGDRFRNKGRINMFERYMPMWVNYYSKSPIKSNVIAINNKSEYSEFWKNNYRNLSTHLIIISDRSKIDDEVLLPDIFHTEHNV